MKADVPKPLVLLNGKPLLQYAIDAASESCCRRVMTIVGCQEEAIRSRVQPNRSVFLSNARWAEGVSSSIKLALDEAERDADGVEAVLFLVGDQPMITAALLDEMIRRFAVDGTPMVACSYAGTIGVPSLFCKDLFPALRKLQGDRGARVLLHLNRGQVSTIDFDGGELDIDTEEDLAAGRSKLR